MDSVTKVNDFPDPLTPIDCDLRGMEWMPLHGNRLITSDFDALATDSEYRAAQRLWWASWQQQVPAASLPDDDRILAHLAGFTRDLKGWSRVKDMALRGFVKCSDGRLYHVFLADEAVKAYEARLRHDTKREMDRKRLSFWRESKRLKRERKSDEASAGNVHEMQNETRGETNSETRFVAAMSPLRQDMTGHDSTNASHSATADAAPEPPDARTEVWRDGLASLRTLTGKSEGTSRAFLGRMLKALGDDCAAGMAILREAETLRPGDVEAWLMGAVRRRAGSREPPPNDGVSVMPCRSDPPERWLEIADAVEEDEKKILRPVVGGHYLDECVNAVCEAAMISDPAWRGDWAPIMAWLRDGLELEAHILPAVRKVAARQGYSPPASLRYFDRPVRDSRAAA